MEVKSEVELLTTAELLERTKIPKWKLIYLCRTEPAAIESMIVRRIPPNSRLWLPEAAERLLAMAHARSKPSRAC